MGPLDFISNSSRVETSIRSPHVSLKIKELSSPRKARARAGFSRIKKIPYRLNWGPENVHF